MILSMFLAHLVGDYILQTDRLARWKSESVWGVLTHCAIVTAVTILFALMVSPFWWQGALLIGLLHTLVDLAQLPFQQRINRGLVPLARLILDQALHIFIILAVLSIGGYITFIDLFQNLALESEAYPAMIYLLAYTALAMPAWVILEFIGYGLANGSPPNFAQATNKYTSSLERWLIATCVIMGQYILIPIVAIPRIILEKGDIQLNQEKNLYLIKYLASIGLALLIGLALKEVTP